MAWAKLHTDILSDPKLMRAARKGMAGLVLLPWLIVAAKHADDDGRLTVGGVPMEPEDVAPMIPGATPATVAEALRNLADLGVLVADRGALRFAAWHPRQAPPSASNEAIRERVRRHRQKRVTRAPVTPCNDHVTTSSNDPVTPGGNAIEEEAEGEKEVEQKKQKLPRSAPPSAGWTAQAGDAWGTERGAPNYGRIGKTLAPLVARYGAVQVLAAWRGYLDSRRGKSFASAEDFAGNYLVHRDAHALAANDDGILAPIPDQPEVSVA